MSASEKQFSFTRAALSTGGRPKTNFLPVARLRLFLIAAATFFLHGGWPSSCRAATEYTFLTLAGVAPGSDDGTGKVARFSSPNGVAADNGGNVYVADTDNHTIRKVTPNGVVMTLAGLAGSAGTNDGTGSAARFDHPNGVAVDSTGNVYVGDEATHTIRKVTSAGVVTTLAGLAYWNGSSNGTGSVARFYGPCGVAVDLAGNVFVADRDNNTIRKVTPGGVVTTLAGLAGSYGGDDGTGSAARFFSPCGVAVDGATNVYVADTGNNSIRMVTPSGVVTTLAGHSGWAGTNDGTGSTALFHEPNGLALDIAGNLYVGDGANHVIRMVTPGGVVTTVAGQAGSYGSDDGTNSAASFHYLSGMAVDGATNVYVADRGNNTIRRMTPVGEVTTLAGLAGGVGSVDGLARAARFNTPQGLAVDGAGNVYVADSWNSTIRKVSLEGIVTTLAGRAGYGDNVDGVGSAARFCDPEGMAVDGATNVYVADWSSQTIRKVATSGAVVTIAGVAWRYGTNDGPGNVAQFANPSDVAVDSATNVYVADSSNNTIRKVSPGGVVTTLAGLGGSSGSTDGTGSAARFDDPEGVAVDSANNVYVADSGNQTIRKVTPGGVVTTLAGRAWNSGSADGTNNMASFCNPSGMAVDSSGNLYVAETGNWTIRKVTPGGVVTTVGGQARNQGSVDGTGSTARFYGPIGVALDSAGNVYVADTGNNTIRRGSPACADRPVIDAASGPVGVSRQLDISPLTAVAWRWRQVRQPATSTAQLSSTTARNPTFTPDVADLYVFELQATNAAGQIAISRVSLTGLPVVSRPLFVPGSLRSINNGQFQFTLAGAAGSNYEIQVTSDLRNWVVWRSILMTNATLDLLDTSTNLQRRFYRARLAQ
jgi:hypothetical protein